MGMNEENFKGIFTALAKSNLIGPADMPNLWKSFVTPYKETTCTTFEALKLTNLFTDQEIDKMKNYMNKAANGEMFTIDEAQEFYNLAKRHLKKR
jgi:hypothetical protein